jgi:hypothetical protein
MFPNCSFAKLFNGAPDTCLGERPFTVLSGV